MEESENALSSLVGSFGPLATDPTRARRTVTVGLRPQLARVTEWQTWWTQNPLSERACGFESRPGHAPSRPSGGGCLEQLGQHRSVPANAAGEEMIGAPSSSLARKSVPAAMSTTTGTSAGVEPVGQAKMEAR